MTCQSQETAGYQVKQEKQFHGELEFNQTEGGTLLLTDSFDNLWDFPLYNQDFLLLGDLTQVSITSKAGSTLYSFLRSNTKSLVSFFAICSAREVFLVLKAYL
jgi:hypothetical protein